MRANKGDTADTEKDSAVEATERKTRAWLTDVVVGLNLCPFARPVVGSDALRIEVCQASDPEGIARALVNEITVIQNAPEAEVATTLVVFPNALTEFEAYLEFLGPCAVRSNRTRASTIHSWSCHHTSVTSMSMAHMINEE